MVYTVMKNWCFGFFGYTKRERDEGGVYLIERRRGWDFESLRSSWSLPKFFFFCKYYYYYYYYLILLLVLYNALLVYAENNTACLVDWHVCVGVFLKVCNCEIVWGIRGWVIRPSNMISVGFFVLCSQNHKHKRELIFGFLAPLWYRHLLFSFINFIT